MMKIFTCSMLFLLTGSLSAQKPSRYELGWSLFHPVAAIQVKNITKRCNQLIARQVPPIKIDGYSSGGKDDAFRHVFFMASYAQRIRIKKLRALGKAHEKANHRQFRRSALEYGEVPDSLSSVMDLQNNELGFAIGCNNQKLPAAELVDLVISSIREGKASIMKRNAAGKFISCDGKIIDPKAYAKTWSIPKCLVPSDYDYRD